MDKQTQDDSKDRTYA